MLHRTNRPGRSASVNFSGVSRASIICGLTARKMRSHRPATSSLIVVLQPSSAASFSALAAVRLAKYTFCGSAALHTARAMAPPMLPQPKNPMVLSITKTFFLKFHPACPRIGAGEMLFHLRLHCKQTGAENQEGKGLLKKECFRKWGVRDAQTVQNFAIRSRSNRKFTLNLEFLLANPSQLEV